MVNRMFGEKNYHFFCAFIYDIFLNVRPEMGAIYFDFVSLLLSATKCSDRIQRNYLDNGLMGSM